MSSDDARTIQLDSGSLTLPSVVDEHTETLNKVVDKLLKQRERYYSELARQVPTDIREFRPRQALFLESYVAMCTDVFKDNAQKMRYVFIDAYRCLTAISDQVGGAEVLFPNTDSFALPRVEGRSLYLTTRAVDVVTGDAKVKIGTMLMGDLLQKGVFADAEVKIENAVPVVTVSIMDGKTKVGELSGEVREGKPDGSEMFRRTSDIRGYLGSQGQVFIQGGVFENALIDLEVRRGNWKDDECLGARDADGVVTWAAPDEVRPDDKVILSPEHHAAAVYHLVLVSLATAPFLLARTGNLPSVPKSELNFMQRMLAPLTAFMGTSGTVGPWAASWKQRLIDGEDHPYLEEEARLLFGTTDLDVIRSDLLPRTTQADITRGILKTCPSTCVPHGQLRKSAAATRATSDNPHQTSPSDNRLGTREEMEVAACRECKERIEVVMQALGAKSALLPFLEATDGLKIHPNSFLSIQPMCARLLSALSSPCPDRTSIAPVCRMHLNLAVIAGGMEAYSTLKGTGVAILLSVLASAPARRILTEIVRTGDGKARPSGVGVKAAFKAQRDIGSEIYCRSLLGQQEGEFGLERFFRDNPKQAPYSAMAYFLQSIARRIKPATDPLELQWHQSNAAHLRVMKQADIMLRLGVIGHSTMSATACVYRSASPKVLEVLEDRGPPAQAFLDLLTFKLSPLVTTSTLGPPSLRPFRGRGVKGLSQHKSGGGMAGDGRVGVAYAPNVIESQTLFKPTMRTNAKDIIYPALFPKLMFHPPIASIGERTVYLEAKAGDGWTQVLAFRERVAREDWAKLDSIIARLGTTTLAILTGIRRDVGSKPRPTFIDSAPLLMMYYNFGDVLKQVQHDEPGAHYGNATKIGTPTSQQLHILGGCLAAGRGDVNGEEFLGCNEDFPFFDKHCSSAIDSLADLAKQLIKSNAQFINAGTLANVEACQKYWDKGAKGWWYLARGDGNMDGSLILVYGNTSGNVYTSQLNSKYQRTILEYIERQLAAEWNGHQLSDRVRFAKELGVVASVNDVACEFLLSDEHLVVFGDDGYHTITIRRPAPLVCESGCAPMSAGCAACITIGVQMTIIQRLRRRYLKQAGMGLSDEDLGIGRDGSFLSVLCTGGMFSRRQRAFTSETPTELQVPELITKVLGNMTPGGDITYWREQLIRICVLNGHTTSVFGRSKKIAPMTAFEQLLLPHKESLYSTGSPLLPFPANSALFIALNPVFGPPAKSRVTRKTAARLRTQGMREWRGVEKLEIGSYEGLGPSVKSKQEYGAQAFATTLAFTDGSRFATTPAEVFDNADLLRPQGTRFESTVKAIEVDSAVERQALTMGIDGLHLSFVSKPHFAKKMEAAVLGDEKGFWEEQIKPQPVSLRAGKFTLIEFKYSDIILATTGDGGLGWYRSDGQVLHRCVKRDGSPLTIGAPMWNAHDPYTLLSTILPMLLYKLKDVSAPLPVLDDMFRAPGIEEMLRAMADNRRNPVDALRRLGLNQLEAEDVDSQRDFVRLVKKVQAVEKYAGGNGEITFTVPPCIQDLYQLDDPHLSGVNYEQMDKTNYAIQAAVRTLLDGLLVNALYTKFLSLLGSTPSEQAVATTTYSLSTTIIPLVFIPTFTHRRQESS